MAHRQPSPLGIVTAQRQATLTRKTLKLVRRYPYVRVFTWFLLRDEPKGYWKSGLVGPNGQPRPVFKVWKRAETARSSALLDALARVYGFHLTTGWARHA